MATAGTPLSSPFQCEIVQHMNHHLTLPVHFRADHRIPLLSPSQFPYSEDWWPYLCKMENKQTNISSTCFKCLACL